MTSTNGTKKLCFVISQIGNDGSSERKRADTVLKHIFKKALEPLNYVVMRADEISQPGSITLQVLERVLQSDLVIADLTNHNPNVFYELAVRHASERPVIHVIQSDQKIPFDVADLRAIYIDLDLEGAERSRSALIAQVKEIEFGHIGETPVKLAGILKHLESGKSEEKLILKQVIDGMTELRTDIRKMLERNSALTQAAFRDMYHKIDSRKLTDALPAGAIALKQQLDMADAPSCHVCGAIMTRNGSCYRCMSCGSTSGCS